MASDQERKEEKIGFFSRIMQSPRIVNGLQGIRIRFHLPLGSFEVITEEWIVGQSTDERIAKLERIKEDLRGSLSAIEELEHDAHLKKQQVDDLEATLRRLKEDQTTAEGLMEFSAESLARTLAKAGAKGRWRGIVEGAILGLLTGITSSILVWYFTKP